jgi:N-acetyltransferase
VRLEPLARHDAAELFWAIGHPAVFAGGFGGGPAGYRDNIGEFVEWSSSRFRWDDGIVWGVRLIGGPANGTLVGTSTTADFDDRNEHAHIGWTAYDPRVWATAVNPEVKLLLLGALFDHGYGRVKLQADERNARSRAAILKLGATFEGIVRRDQKRADGSWRDTAVYSVTIDDWPTVRAGLESRLAATSGPVTLAPLATPEG